MTTNKVYVDLLRALLSGSEVCPRYCPTRELLGYKTMIDMQHPIVTIPERKLNYRFMVTEAHWILTGDCRLNHHPEINKKLRKYSDDNQTLSGAYGPPFIEQLRYVVAVLNEDHLSRQAVITLWRPSPRVSKDIPCTVSLQFLIRDNKLHTIVNMRSSDAFLGWPYDVFSFSMMSYMVVASLGMVYGVGNLTIFAGSQHIYEENYESVEKIVDIKCYVDNFNMSIYGFESPEFLTNTLESIMNTKEVSVLDVIKKELGV